MTTPSELADDPDANGTTVTVEMAEGPTLD